ncbi:MAG: hypothetical protein ACK5OX_17185 [Desertimonas sp.]
MMLAPSADVVARREAGRGKVGYRTMTPDELDAGMRADTPRRGLWLDTSELSVAQTVDAILARSAESVVA